MTEREVRHVLQEMHRLYGPIHPLRESVDKALSATPDIVAVLRWLKEQEWFEGDRGKWLPNLHWHIFERIIARIERDFHVRLTDDGWEYTDDRRGKD